jgi:hypothetical protein
MRSFPQLTSAAVLAAILLTLAAPRAHAVTLGVGGFGGTSISVLQDDNKGGGIFGARVPIGLIPLFTLEPYFATGSGGTLTKIFGDNTYTRSGFDQKVFGANLLFGSPIAGAGIKFINSMGISSNKLTRPGSTDISEMGYSEGLGLGVGFTENIAILVRGDLNLVKTDLTSRKFANATVNVYYTLTHDTK